MTTKVADAQKIELDGNFESDKIINPLMNDAKQV